MGQTKKTILSWCQVKSNPYSQFLPNLKYKSLKNRWNSNQVLQMSLELNTYLSWVLFQIMEAKSPLRTKFKKWRWNSESCLLLSSQLVSLVIIQAKLAQCFVSKMGFIHLLRLRFCNQWPNFGRKECHVCMISLCLFKTASSVNCCQSFQSNSLKTLKATSACLFQTQKNSKLSLINPSLLLKGLSIWKNTIAAYAVEIWWGISFSFFQDASIYTARNALRSSCLGGYRMAQSQILLVRKQDAENLWTIGTSEIWGFPSRTKKGMNNSPSTMLLHKWMMLVGVLSKVAALLLTLRNLKTPESASIASFSSVLIAENTCIPSNDAKSTESTYFRNLKEQWLRFSLKTRSSKICSINYIWKSVQSCVQIQDVR